MARDNFGPLVPARIFFRHLFKRHEPEIRELRKRREQTDQKKQICLPTVRIDHNENLEIGLAMR